MRCSPKASRRTRLALLVAPLVALATVRPAPAASPLVGHDALIARAPRPAWLKEGVRLTFLSASAALPTRGPDGKVTAPAGRGLTQLDFVGVAGGKTAVALRSYAEGVGALGAGPKGYQLIGETGMVAAVGFGDFWVEPGLLRKVAAAQGPESPWKVIQGPYPAADGRKVQAISFATGGGAQDLSRTSYVYDATTGILISMSESRRRSLNEDLRGTAVNQLLAVRDVTWPWAGDATPVPGWIPSTREIDYRGTRIITVPGAMQSEFAVSFRVTLRDPGPRWIVTSTTETYQMPGFPPVTSAPVTRVAGPSQVGGTYIHPRALAKLRPSQELDRDPHTGSRITVEHVGPGQNGRPVVTIKEETTYSLLIMDYDLTSGALVLSTFQDRILNISTQVALTGRR